MQLDIGPFQPRVRTQKRAGFGKVRGQKPLAAVAPLEIARHRAERRPERDAHQAPVRRAVHQGEIDMIGEVGADARQFVQQRYAVTLQFLARADAGQQQQLRRAEDARRQDDFGARVDSRAAARTLDLDARGAAPVEHDARRVPSGQHREVRPIEYRMQEGDGRAAAAAAALRHLVEPRPVLRGAVEIAVRRQARADRRFDESM